MRYEEMMPGVKPPNVPLPRPGIQTRQQAIIYAPNFQRPLMAEDREYPYVIIPDTNPLIVPASGSVTNQFTINGDNDYYLETLRVHETNDNDEYTVQLTDTRSGVQLGSAPIHSSLVLGSGTLPGYFSQLDWLVCPKGARSTVRIDLANLTAVSFTVFLCIAGRRQLVNPGVSRTQGA